MAQEIRPEAREQLTAQDKARLLVWKAVYCLQADYGFTLEEARRLTFCRWLYQRGRLVS